MEAQPISYSRPAKVLTALLLGLMTACVEFFAVGSAFAFGFLERKPSDLSALIVWFAVLGGFIVCVVVAWWPSRMRFAWGLGLMFHSLVFFGVWIASFFAKPMLILDELQLVAFGAGVVFFAIAYFLLYELLYGEEIRRRPGQ